MPSAMVPRQSLLLVGTASAAAACKALELHCWVLPSKVHTSSTVSLASSCSALCQQSSAARRGCLVAGPTRTAAVYSSSYARIMHTCVRCPPRQKGEGCGVCSPVSLAVECAVTRTDKRRVCTYAEARQLNSQLQALPAEGFCFPSMKAAATLLLANKPAEQAHCGRLLCSSCGSQGEGLVPDPHQLAAAKHAIPCPSSMGPAGANAGLTRIQQVKKSPADLGRGVLPRLPLDNDIHSNQIIVPVSESLQNVWPRKAKWLSHWACLLDGGPQYSTTQ